MPFLAQALVEYNGTNGVVQFTPDELVLKAVDEVIIATLIVWLPVITIFIGCKLILLWLKQRRTLG